MWGLGQHTLVGIVVGLIWGLGQDTLLGIAIVVGLCGASGDTLHWVLLLVYGGVLLVYGGYCCWLCCTSDNTLYWVLLWVMRGFGQRTLLGIIRCEVGCLHQWVQYNIFF
jgi:hypothetical protein